MREPSGHKMLGLAIILPHYAMYVFDTNVLVAGLRSRKGASFVILQALRYGLIKGAASTALMLEYTDVLKRDANLAAFWTTEDEVDVILGVLASLMEPISIYFSWRPQLTDPNDEMVLECALNAQAVGIVTFNTQDFLPAANQLQVKLIRPGELVQQLNLQARLPK
jgi:putative PIN family toxin of toxin-antitoxin system